MGRRKAETQWSEEVPVRIGMKESEIVDALETVARSLDVEVRYEKGDFAGGLCKVGNKSLILLHRDDPADKKINVLARELGEFDLDQIYLLPALRDIIDKARTADKAVDVIFDEE